MMLIWPQSQGLYWYIIYCLMSSGQTRLFFISLSYQVEEEGGGGLGQGWGVTGGLGGEEWLEVKIELEIHKPGKLERLIS